MSVGVEVVEEARVSDTETRDFVWCCARVQRGVDGSGQKVRWYAQSSEGEVVRVAGIMTCDEELRS